MMAKPEVVQGLERAYAGLLHDKARHEAEIEAIRMQALTLPDVQARKAETDRSLLTLEETILRFQPDWTPHHLVPQQIKKKVSPFKRGFVTTYVIASLRNSGEPMTLRGLMDGFLIANGLPVSPSPMRESVRSSIRSAMVVAERRGSVVKTGKNAWQIVSRADRQKAGGFSMVDFDA